MENDVVRSRTISIRGRNVTFRKTCGQVLDTTFEELCDRVRVIYKDYIKDLSVKMRIKAKQTNDFRTASRSKRLFAIESSISYSYNKRCATIRSAF